MTDPALPLGQRLKALAHLSTIIATAVQSGGAAGFAQQSLVDQADPAYREAGLKTAEHDLPPLPRMDNPPPGPSGRGRHQGPIKPAARRERLLPAVKPQDHDAVPVYGHKRQG